MSARRMARPEVLRRLPLDRHTLIEASAGTGKTFTLEHLVVELVLSTDVTLDRILFVTFTEKATNELRSRVRSKLEGLLSGAGESPSEAQTRAGDFWTIDDAARARLARALHAFDGATIATIHAFCQRVLRDNAFASGRLFDERQVDGRHSFGRAMLEALRRQVAGDAGRAPWLETALRSGWSMDRIEALLWRSLQAKAELRPSFDRSALDAALEAFPVEDARRASMPRELQALGIPAQTAKALARRFYEMAEGVERARAARSTPAFVVEVQDVKLAYVVEKLQGATFGAGPTGRLCAAALALARETPPFAAALTQALLTPVRDELARRKREAGQYDFDDMLALVQEALHGPQGDALVTAMRERWRYALIDEFQDTDETQWSIFRRAFFDRGGRASVLYLVGDPKQSIYRFRGADVHTYLRARDEVVAGGGERIDLYGNYRAVPALVDATNALFDQDARDPVFNGAVRYTRVECGRADRALLDGDGREAAPVHVFRFPAEISLPELGRLVAREVRVITDPTRPWRLGGRPLGHEDIFVLTRNAREGRIVGSALREAGVPHAFYKEEGLFQTDEARDVRTLLAAIDDPGDRARRLSAWLTPFFEMRLGDVERARDLTPSDPLVGRLHAWKAIAEGRDYAALFDSILVDSGVLRREIFFAAGERALTNTMHVFVQLLEYARSTHASLRELLLALSGLIDGTRLPLDLEGNAQRLESERRSVQIMTIHKSKGLQAPIVFVAGGFGPPPSDEVHVYHQEGRRLAWIGPPAAEVAARIKEEDREEDARLMYVALTRAQGRLYLPCAVTKSPRGPYAVVNRRVVDLASAGHAALFVEDVMALPAAAEDARSLEATTWQPPIGLLREEDDGVSYDALRGRHSGAVVTSYTRMKGDRASTHVAFIEQAADRRAQKARDAADEGTARMLRAARTTGIFLHELLERVPIGSFSASRDLDEWRARPDVVSLFDEELAAHRVDLEQREHAERLVWAAYRTPIVLPGGVPMGGLATGARVVREMEFVFPIVEPERSTRDDPRAYVRGSLDLAVEHDGRTYFVDWKRDSLPSYDRESLDGHVRARYEEQAWLYSLAVIKLLGVRDRAHYDARFGGIVYCFLRGLDASGRGVWSSRPGWDDVLSWERALGSRPWGSAEMGA